jgi:ribosomal protein L7/L12
MAETAGLAAVTELPPEILNEVRFLVGQGRKIDAIKRVREVTLLGLTEAKDLVERL